MNIIVCVKQVIDPQAPPSSFKIDASTNKVVPPPGVPPVISTFDEYAVEAALKIKETVGGKVTALSLGVNLLREVVKKPLAMGADELILLEDPAFADGDSWATAYALPMARKVEVTDGKARVERVIPDGYEVIEVTLPALVTLSNEHPAPRYPNLKGIMAAKKIEPIVWKLADIGVDPSQIGANGQKSKLFKLFQPVRDTKCEVMPGETPEEAAANLAIKLREVKLL